MSSREFAELSNAELVALDQACDAFESELQRAHPVDLKDYLATATPALRQHLLRELLVVELEHKRRSGEEIVRADYDLRFPEDSKTLDDILNKMVPESFERTAHTSTHDGSTIDLDGRNPSRVTGTAPLELPSEFGRYRLERLLGRGGMGAVYLAHDTQLDRQVALKMPDFVDRSEFGEAVIERFYREARAMASVMHPNLCTIYDVAEFGGRHYLTMAYIEGHTLATQLRADGAMPDTKAVELVRRLALAIQPAHEVGVIHRDLKPSNVMLDNNGAPFITDFGLASRLHHDEANLTHSGAIVGSPAYMAPEQVGGSRHGIAPETDVYALGVILYELICGQRPYEGTALEVLGKLTSQMTPPPLSSRAEVDKKIEAICNKAMAHEPNERFPTAIALAESLEECLASKRDTPEAAPVTTGRLSNLPRPVVVTGSILTLVVLALSLVMVFQGERATPEYHLDGATADADAGSRDSVGATAPSNPQTNVPQTSAQLFLSPEHEWTPPLPVDFYGDGKERNCNSPSISNDGLQMHFVGWTPTSNTGQILMSVRSSQHDHWSHPKPLGSAVNANSINGTPTLSPDGKTILFGSDRDGGSGDYDLWMAERATTSGPFGPAVNLGPAVNGGQDDGSPEFSGDGLSFVFHSNRDGGHGGYDLWCCRRKSLTAPFESVVNLGRHVNTAFDERHPTTTPDGTVLIYRAGDGHFKLATRNTVEQEFSVPDDIPFHVKGPNDGEATATANQIFFTRKRAGKERLFYSQRIRRLSSTALPNYISNAELLLSDDFEWSQPERVEIAGGAGKRLTFSPLLVANPQTLFMTQWTHATKSYDIVASKGASSGKSWDAPVSVAGLNTEYTDVHATLSSDGHTVVFSSDRPGGVGKDDLWIAKRTAWDAPFDEPINLGTLVNSEQTDTGSTLSEDGLTLIFQSDRRSDTNNFDLWRCTRNSIEEPFGAAELLAGNGYIQHASASLSSDGTALLFARRGGGLRFCARQTTNDDFGEPTRLSSFFDHSTDQDPYLSSDGKTLYFASRRGSSNLHLWRSHRIRKTGPETGFPAGSSADILLSPEYQWKTPQPVKFTPASADIRTNPRTTLLGTQLLTTEWRSKSASDDLVLSHTADGVSWTQSQPLAGKVNGPDADVEATFSYDGLTIVFSSNRRSGNGGFDLWMASRSSLETPFGEPLNLELANSDKDDGGPTLSYDSLTLIFHSDRSRGLGGHDLWMSRRTSIHEPFQEPENLGPPLNDANNQNNPSLSWDGTVLLYHDNGLWMSVRSSPSHPFSPPIYMPQQVNGAETNSPHLSADSRELYFSRRESPNEAPSVWYARRVRREE